MTLRLRTTAAAATLAVVLGVSACSSADPEPTKSSTPNAPATSAQTTSESETSQTEVTSAPEVSAGSESTESPQQSSAPTVQSFPKPPGLKVAQSGSIGTAGFALAGTVADPQAAYEFWLEELPKAGWTVGQHSFAGQGATAIGSIEFTSPGFGASTIGIFGTRVAIAVQN